MTDEQRLIAKLYRDIEELEKDNKFLQETLKFLRIGVAPKPERGNGQTVEIAVWDEVAYRDYESDKDDLGFLYEGDDDVY